MPYTGVVLSFVALHAALFLILLAHWVAAAGMFPEAAKAFADEYDRRPLRAMLLGIFTYGIIFVLVLNMAKIPNGFLKFIIAMAGLVALLIAFIGSSGLALRIGRNLSADAEPWRHVLRGGVMLALVFITPFLGWGLILHLGLASGFGAFFLARPWKAKQPVPPLRAAATAPAGVPPIPSVPSVSIP
jgi:hypothetical protein